MEKLKYRWQRNINISDKNMMMNVKMEKKKENVFLIIIMEIYDGQLRNDKKKEKEYLNIVTRINMKENEKMIKWKGKVYIIVVMELKLKGLERWYLIHNS